MKQHTAQHKQSINTGEEEGGREEEWAVGSGVALLSLRRTRRGVSGISSDGLGSLKQ